MYKLIKNKQDSIFEIIEIESGLVIKRNADRDSIYPLYRDLEKGTGFCGFTPPFFLYA